MEYVSYIRVSTARQGESGLGLQAQREAISRHVTSFGGQIIAEFKEVESGGKNDRPKLASAISLCRRTRATLIIAKLDRLARNVCFVSTLLESGVDFLATDQPHANKLTIHILAAVAEAEREMISRRTKEALHAAKARGVTLGTPANLTDLNRATGRAVAAQNRIKHATEFANEILKEIRERDLLQKPLMHIARQLNISGIRTSKGLTDRWTAGGVKRVIKRALGDTVIG